jgi:hypothetical protein
VVPTAADLAYGARFESDRIVQSDRIVRGGRHDTCLIGLSGCSFREPVSIEDFKDDISGFNRFMVGCLANHRKTLIPLWGITSSDDNCAKLTFADIPPPAMEIRELRELRSGVADRSAGK